MALYFETAVRYDKMSENGKVKKTTEKFLVDALSFAEAEARTIEEQTPYIGSDFDVKVAKKTKIAEIFNLGAERYYLAKVAFMKIPNRSAKLRVRKTHSPLSFWRGDARAAGAA